MGVCKVDDYLEDALRSLRGRATNDSAGFGHLRCLKRLPYARRMPNATNGMRPTLWVQ